MGTCAECVYWKRDGTTQHLGSCLSPHVCKGYHLSYWEVPLSSILVENDEGWALLTGPQFGCVHWAAQQREPEDH